MSKRAVVFFASLAVSAGIGLLAFYLGAWGYGARSGIQHDTRLRRMLEKKPTIAQVVAGLADDGSPLIAEADDPETLSRLAAERGRNRAREIVEKGRRATKVRVFRAGDMVYFLFFDADGRMADFVFVAG